MRISDCLYEEKALLEANRKGILNSRTETCPKITYNAITNPLRALQVLQGPYSIPNLENYLAKSPVFRSAEGTGFGFDELWRDAYGSPYKFNQLEFCRIASIIKSTFAYKQTS